MTRIIATVLLLPILSSSLLLGVIGKRGYAQPNPPTIEQLYRQLQAAVCLNRWDDALALIDPMIESRDISARYREELTAFREQVEEWQSTEAQFLNQPQCDSITAQDQQNQQETMLPGQENQTRTSSTDGTDRSTDAPRNTPSEEAALLSECMELGNIVNWTDSQANSLFSRTDVDDLNSLVSMLAGLARVSEQAAVNLQAIQLTDSQLHSYQQDFIRVYQGFNRVTQGFVAATGEREYGNMEQSNTQIQNLASQEVELINRVNAYCGRDIIANS